MPVQPTEPLQQHIGWYRIRNKKVRIDIEALLASLSADYHDPRALPPRSQRSEHSAIQILPVIVGIARMVEQSWNIRRGEFTMVRDGIRDR